MTIPAHISCVILDTVLNHLALLFLTAAGGDQTAARDAARQMLAAYRPETEAELSLAAEVISFSFQALDALSQAATPGTALTKVIRLRGSAVSLSREAHKSQRKLDQQQKPRTLRQPDEATLPAHDQPETPAPDTTIRPTLPANTRHAGQTWTQAFQQRQTAKRIAETLKKKQANYPATPVSTSVGAELSPQAR